jgi:hypothetical protein
MYSLNGLDHNIIFQEIPLRISNTHLAQAFLYELSQSESFSHDFDRLTLSKDSIIETQLEILLDSLEYYTEEIKNQQWHEKQLVRRKQNQVAWLTKRKAENAVRIAAGQPELPETDPVLFKPIPEVKILDKFYCDSNCIPLTISLYIAAF